MKGQEKATRWVVLFATFALAAALIACKQTPQEPPSDRVVQVMEGIKAAYNADDVEAFTADFGDIMFTQGFTKGAYHDVMDGLMQRCGTWESENYAGYRDGAYIWRAKFEKTSLNVVLVLNSDGQVTGLWFR
jgi:hypothetical protein